MPDDDVIFVGGGSSAFEMLDELAELYHVVHSEPGLDAGPLYDQDPFVTRTRNQARRDGFSIKWARDVSGSIVGFSFGLPLGSGGWWTGQGTLPPQEVLAATKFAVVELIVAVGSRGRGVGRRLLDRLLEGRPEPYAILTARPDTLARQVYARWGWEQVGTHLKRRLWTMRRKEVFD